MPLGRKVVASAASRFFQPLKPHSGRVPFDPRCSESAGIDRRQRKPDPPVSRAAAQAGLIRQDGVPFRKPLRCPIPAPKSRFCQVHAGQHEVLPAPAGFLEIRRAGPPATMTPLTPCRTQHNNPNNRETAGAAVHAAVKTVPATNRITVVAAVTVKIVANANTVANAVHATPTGVPTVALSQIARKNSVRKRLAALMPHRN